MGRKESKIQRWASHSLGIIFFALSSQYLISSPIDHHQERFEDVALKIWEYAELGYLEEKSSSLLQQELKDSGFSIQSGVAGIPTAFIAEYNNGGPVLGILGEFDALPGLSQQNVPFKTAEGLSSANGHACGHHLFGAASAWAVVAIKDWLEESGTPGTIRFYGTPAEEGGSGKVYIARDGYFDDVDIVLHWHPASGNSADAQSSNSNKSGKFTFSGISAHAASAPEKGRSALDGVEAMNMMVNMMREHVPQESRIHYVITKGGLAPNVVPDVAEVYYYVRHPRMNVVDELFQRVVKAAEGAAMGTETSMSYEVMHGNYAVLPNETLQKMIHENLSELGGISYNKDEEKFAEEIYQTLVSPSLELGSQNKIKEYAVTHTYGSTDVGDLTWLVPTGGFRTATWVPGTSAHTWQAVSAGGMSIGMKGMMNAAKVIAGTAVDLYNDPETIKNAKKELIERRGPKFNYYSLLGERKPPLDYRK